ncbi:MAG TPA: efflux RND transporter permease subunit, partial [Rhodospirillales bacterium]|nr:efflux RND transporter permease subunit [Rhodospirillales bacterium]
MALAAFSVRRSVFTRFAILLFAVAGFGAYFTLGQLEDPEYTVKTAVIVTPYPLASPEQVEQEVTDVIELEIQKLSEVDHIESYSSPGLSRIKVQIRPQYLAKDLPQVWDKLRAKVRNVESRLPPGAGRPEINDEFGDVYGHLVALVSDGFPPAEMERYAKDLKRELSLIEGVAKVDLWGVQERRVYIDTIRSRLEQLGISENTIARSLQAQNAIVDAG